MSVDAPTILPVLNQVLQHLTSNPYPHVPTPPPCKRRASVAVIIRVRPAFEPVLPTSASVVNINSSDTDSATPVSTLDEFFAQDWVSHGDPEVLFIKRAGRAGDRWSGHVALPGGKRDPEDASDIVAAIRETREEVGMDLTSNCINVGNLPERVVATTWGREALMVLCPYLFLLTSKDTSRVLPQPSEVASAHWVPLRALLSPTLRTTEEVDTSSRMAKPYGRVAQLLLRSIVGRMTFSAVRLTPSESIFASSIAGFVPETTPASSDILTHQQPLHLWGLTLGVLADFLDMLPPHTAVRLWKYPTFTVPDLRFFVWLLTRDLRHNNADHLSAGTWSYNNTQQSHSQLPSNNPSPPNELEIRCRPANGTAIDATTAAIPLTPPTTGTSTRNPNAMVTEAEPLALQPSRQEGRQQDRNTVGISGLGVGKDRQAQDVAYRLLAGYYERINWAVGVFLVYRTLLGGTLCWTALKYWRRWKSS